MHNVAARRVTKLNAAGMQRDEPHPLVVAGRAEGPLAAVEFVAQEDVPAGGALDADLVRAARFERNFQK